MQLAICTDVFADLSYTEMLDKVKSLGIDAVEMTAGGWGARKHCNTAELLADDKKLDLLPEEICGSRRSIPHAILCGRPKPAKNISSPCMTAPDWQESLALRRS